MTSKNDQQDLVVPSEGAKRRYSSPLLKTFGDWYTLTLNGGVVVAADANNNTKTGR
ncbi:MAG: hypothetical protein ABIP81_05970 [Terriglobales bacterium]